MYLRAPVAVELTNIALSRTKRPSPCQWVQRGGSVRPGELCRLGNSTGGGSAAVGPCLLATFERVFLLLPLEEPDDLGAEGLWRHKRPGLLVEVARLDLHALPEVLEFSDVDLVRNLRRPRRARARLQCRRAPRLAC